MTTRNMNIYQIEDPSRSLKITFNSDNVCGRCGIGVEWLESNGFYSFDGDRIYVCLIEHCPVCKKAALREFPQLKRGNITKDYLDLTCTHSYRYPLVKNQQDFSEAIDKLSPRFVDIYHQAEAAEQDGCRDICGAGYRKALEFLVKDFAIRHNPSDAERIASTNLGEVISKLGSEKLKVLAERSAWLGNDETHYVKKHEEYSVSDMKSFILAAATYIDSELCFEKAAKITPARK